MAAMIPSSCSIVKLDTPTALTLDFGRANIAFHVSTRERSSSKTRVPVASLGNSSLPAAKATGQWITADYQYSKRDLSQSGKRTIEI